MGLFVELDLGFDDVLEELLQLLHIAGAIQVAVHLSDALGLQLSEEGMQLFACRAARLDGLQGLLMVPV